MRILVIGGTLFIGRRLVERLLAEGHRVTVLHRNRATALASGAEGLLADRNDAAAVRRVLTGREFDAVFDNVYDWQRGTTAEQVGAAARAVRHAQLARYVFMSSVGAYQEGLGLGEDAPLAGPGAPPYAANKAATERLLFAMHRESGFPAVTLRPPFVYGPENPFNREAYFWRRMHDGRPILVPGDGGRLMQFLHVDDLVAACVAVLSEPRTVGRAFNLGNLELPTQNQAITEICRAAGREPRLVHVARNVANPADYFAEMFDLPPITMRVELARELLGFQPRAFADGLAESYAWWRTHDRLPAPDYSIEDQILRNLES